MAKRAVAYVKADGTSTDCQPDPEDLRIVHEYAREHGYNVSKVICDPNRSSLDLRPGTPIVEALEALHSQDAEALLAPSLSSLPGDVFDQEVLLAHLQEHGFPFLAAVDDGTLHDNSENRGFLRQFAARTLSLGKRLLAIRLKGARRAGTKTRGTRQGPKPYGTRAGEGPILERIKELSSKHAGYARIANQLNAEGIKPRQGKEWHATTIANILGARNLKRARERTRKRRS
jgi:DNA invertase Pin-like site-specific DNA recombinase